MAKPPDFNFAQFRAAVFDLDGTLVHSEHVWDAAKLQVIADYGHTPSLALLRAHLGRGLAGFLDEVFGYPLPAETRDEIANKIGKIADNLLPTMREHVEGAADFLRGLHAHGLRIAICSSSPRRHIESAIEALEISEEVELIISGADLPRGKPDPLPYVETVRRLGLPAATACAIEESPSGVASAMRAGLSVLAVGKGCSGPEFAHCAYQAESYAPLGLRT